jgi:YidC/Oxa1 family membrane protein insertase
VDIFYNIIIYPLIQIIEFVFVFSQKLLRETGISVIAVSAVVSVLCLPLYNVAEKWQQLERDIQKKLKPKIDRIKAVFKGDEQFMILSAYYRQNHYHPVYALRGTLGLLIQIPFFIAAYTYLSHLEALKGAHFLFISDLGAQDALLKIGVWNINLLPILMTIINIAAGAVYTKGFPVKDKIQLYGMAALFLILLYKSPAGLVLYWTCNNIFSLLKNCAAKIPHSEKILYTLFPAVILFTEIYLIFFHDARIVKLMPVIIVLLILFLFMVFINKIRKIINQFIQIMDSRTDEQMITKIFLGADMLIFLLSGLVIPSALISSSAGEFSFLEPYTSPFPFIGTTLLQSAGFFLFWCPAVYFFFSKNTKIVLSVLMSIVSAITLMNTFAFPGDYGFLTQTLMFSNARGFNFRLIPYMLNLFAITGITALCIISVLAKNKTGFCSIQMILILTLTLFGISRIVKIEADFEDILSRKTGFSTDTEQILKPVYHFSRNGKNVIVIMLDRAISGYAPYIFDEKPDLRESFSGFTWYPNCVSLGGATLFGLPPLFGGYDYSPDKMQEQDERPLVKKWNEVLLVLPRLFSENGFHVTVTDPICANFINEGDLSIFDGYYNVHAENLHNRFTGYWLRNHPDIKLLALSELIENNLIHFSFFKMAPFFFREMLYNGGNWMVLNEFNAGNNKIDQLTLDNYSMLDTLPLITKIDDTDIGTYTAMTNDLTHEPAFFQAPDYTPSNNITDFGSSPFADEDHYHANMAALVLLGKWFDYLKREGIYDNTRIIISSDHGWTYNTRLPNFTLPDGDSLLTVNPLLLVKDFKNDAVEGNAGVKADDTFMSHADVPYLASKDITDAVNPFTGKPLFYDKTEGIVITTWHKWEAIDTNKYKWNIPGDKWLHIHDNIFDPNKWEKAER